MFIVNIIHIIVIVNYYQAVITLTFTINIYYDTNILISYLIIIYYARLGGYAL